MPSSPKPRGKGTVGTLPGAKANSAARRVRWIGLAMLAGFVFAYFADVAPIAILRLKLFDMMQAARPRAVSVHPVTIVDIDDDSIAEIGQWPWPRTVLARLVTGLTELGAVLIAFDVIFPEGDRLDPKRIADENPDLAPDIRERLREMTGNDAAFAKAIRASRVVLGRVVLGNDALGDDTTAAPPTQWPISAGTAGQNVSSGTQMPPLEKTVAVRRAEHAPAPEHLIARAPLFLRNTPEIEAAAAGHGLFSLIPETDGTVRRLPMVIEYKGDLFPALSLEALRVALGRDGVLVEIDEAGVSGVRVARDLAIPTDRHGRAWPYFSHRDPSRSVSARRVLAGTVDPALIKDRLLLVGTSAAGLPDTWATPVEPAVPGVEIHAQVIENAVTGTFLHRPRFATTIESSLLLVGGLMVIWLVPRVGAGWTLIPFTLIVGGAIATSWFLFSVHRMLVDVGFAVVAMLLLFTVLTYVGHAREQAGRRRIRTAFSRYLSPAMVEELAENPGRLRLGGETRTMSILFCDVRGFTVVAEAYKDDPERLTNLVNQILTPLTGVVLAHDGTVDKYIGDCIMAFWNAPLDDAAHARHACLTALEMQAAMAPLNERLAQDMAPKIGTPLSIGIGVNTGTVVVGNMGSDQRFDYSVLGDAVNLASRLEGLCKTYNVGIVVGESTRARAEELAFLELDQVRVKGRSEAVRIFTVIGDETVALGSAFRDLAEAHAHMLGAFRQRRWQEARTGLDACRQQMEGFPVGGLYDVYARRIDSYISEPPPPDWDGVFNAVPSKERETKNGGL